MSTYHTPVLLEEVIEGLSVKKGNKYIDATVGGGGHTIEIVKRGGTLLGIDTDQEAVRYSMENIKRQLPNATWDADIKLIQGNFRDIVAIAKINGFGKVDGILFDLGVSSHQLDTETRGFSYRFMKAPLDLRLDQTQGNQAKDIANTYSEAQLYEILTRFGEEQLARTIADALVRARRMKPIQTTGDLVAVIAPFVKNPIHLRGVLSRVFQAFRIATNDELDTIRKGLVGAYELLNPKGRLAVISFHSLEDRIVKQTMGNGTWNIITKNPIRVERTEAESNPRSQSAKLRIAEKL
mgnify:CR=1 FL=1